MMEEVALIAAIILPLWNIPLVVRIIKRKSSQDISLSWAIGVWFCLLAMFPAGVASRDIVWKTFNIINFILFSFVTLVIIIFRRPKNKN